MPRTYQKVVGSRSYVNYSEDDVAKAMQQITSGEMSQRDAAGHFGIPRSTLKNKLKGKHSKPIGGQTVLSKTEEEVISNCCISMSIYGFPVDTFDLRCTVKSHLDRRGSKVEKFTNNLPGKEWTQSFLRRHRELTMRFASNIKRKRAQVSLESITDYFEHLSAELEGIPATHIWNYDETNLTDDPGNKRVIAKRGSKYPERIINATKAATSLMFCGSANGQILPHMLCIRLNLCGALGRKMVRLEPDIIDQRVGGSMLSALKTGSVEPFSLHCRKYLESTS